MEEKNVDKLFETFDKLDENELTLVLNQVGRRMLILRASAPDSSFWYSILMRVNKWLATEPIVNEDEKKLLINEQPSNLNGRTRAIKNMRERSGRNMSACMAVVDKWISDNIDLVHESVRTSYLNKINKKNSNVT